MEVRWLDEAGMRTTVGASTLTLGSLVRHFALVEDNYFSHRMMGRSSRKPWEDVDWDSDPDAPAWR